MRRSNRCAGALRSICLVGTAALAFACSADVDVEVEDTAAELLSPDVAAAAARIDNRRVGSMIQSWMREDDGFPEEISFPIPSSCYTDPAICCGVSWCRIDADLKEYEGDLPRVEFEQIDLTRLRFTIRARINTPWALPTAKRGPLGGWINCNVYMDSRWSGWPHMRMDFDLHWVPDEETGGMRAQVENPGVSGLSGGDFSIWGEFLCRFANEGDAAVQMMSSFRQRLPGAIEQLLCQACEGDSDCSGDATCNGDGVCIMPSGRCEQGL